MKERILRFLRLTSDDQIAKLNEQTKQQRVQALVTIQDEKETALNKIAKVSDELQSTLLAHQSKQFRRIIND